MATYICYVEKGHQKVIEGTENWEYIQDDRRIVLNHADLSQVLALADIFVSTHPDAVMKRTGNTDLNIEVDHNKPNDPIYLFYARNEDWLK